MHKNLCKTCKYDENSISSFPCDECTPQYCRYEPTEESIKEDEVVLRDNFAMAALTGVIIQCSGDRADVLEGRSPEQYFAWKAYGLADAMLAEREKSK